MGQKKQRRMPGLIKRGEIWHINKQVDGQRICESTGTSQLEEAQRYLVRKLETRRKATVYGERAKRTFDEASARYIEEHQDKSSLSIDLRSIELLMPSIGHLHLEAVHMETLKPFIKERRKDGVKARTINHGLQIVRCILNLAANEWVDDNGKSWLYRAPKIKLLPQTDARAPYPLSWAEQDRLFARLAPHLREMALFAVNTGCRDQEICHLRWEWEVAVPVPEIGSVFVIPWFRVKNGEDRLVVLNDIAKAVVERQRGKHPDRVFTYRGSPIAHMLNSGWRRARAKVALSVRVHDLKHTFGRRLRAANVSFEDRQDLLGHKSERMTTHYSPPELISLLKSANTVCQAQNREQVCLLKTSFLPSRAKVAHAVKSNQF